MCIELKILNMMHACIDNITQCNSALRNHVTSVITSELHRQPPPPLPVIDTCHICYR